MTKKNSIHWVCLERGINYLDSIDLMNEKVQEVISNPDKIYVLLVEYDDLYTLGSSAKTEDLVNIGNIPFFHTDRGGKVTYHGPGQLVIYPIIHLSHFDYDIKRYVQFLQQVLINSFNKVGVKTYACADKIGIWTVVDGKERKIASIGIRVKKWVAYHGVAVNISPDMANFNKIIACGLRDYKQTSLGELGFLADINSFIEILRGELVI